MFFNLKQHEEMRKEFLLLFILSLFCIKLMAQTAPLPSIVFQGEILHVNPQDHFIAVPWGQINVITGAGSENDGNANTQNIVNNYGNWSQGNYAANICAQLDAHGFDDWYLPSIDELLLLHQNRQQIGGFQTATYWSSTENPMGVTAKQVAFPGGYVIEQPKSAMARVRCVRKTENMQSQTSGNLNHETANVLVASRYAVKSDGTKGLIYGSKFLSFFTITATSFIFETTARDIAINILKGSAKELAKGYGTKKLVSSLPEMDVSKIRYISYAFPLKPGEQVAIEDIIILLETENDKDLVPLGVPVELSYFPYSDGLEEPLTAIKHGYKTLHDEASQKYPYMGIPQLWYRLRPNNLSSSNFNFSTYGVVDGYMTKTIREGGELIEKTLMIIKEYENYDLLFMQTTDLNFIAVDVSDLQQIPAPGSVINLWGRPVRLSGIDVINLSDYSSDN
jgi:hypothetical protein